MDWNTPGSRQPARNRSVGTAGRWVRLGTLAAATLIGLALVRPGGSHRLDLDYTIALSEVTQGHLAITLLMSGSLPEPCRLVLPLRDTPLDLESSGPGAPTLLVQEASHLRRDGSVSHTLSLTQDGNGWLLHHRGGDLTRMSYLVDLPRTSSLVEDIRLHLTGPLNDGFQAAGYHLFLVPDRCDSCQVSVRFRDAKGGQLAVPWRRHRALASGAVSGNVGNIPPNDSQDTVFYPSDLRDLYASLLAWGDLRLLTREVSGCTLRLGVGSSWLFSDHDLARLMERIAGAEIEFFGSAPHPVILCLIAPNPIRAREGFEYYGVHVGHSLQLFLDPETTYADLTERAANVAAHEMFHGWLGEAIMQDDTQMLWFVEGVTTWFATRFLQETGLWNSWRAENVVGERIDQNYYDNPLLGEMSVAEAAAGIMSNATTTRFAYAGGALAAANLDRWLATTSGAIRPLDEVLQHLYQHRDGTPLTRGDLVTAVGAVTGADCNEWLDLYVYGKETLPRLETLF